MQHLADFKAFYGRNKNIDSAIRQIYLLYNSGSSSNLMKVCSRWRVSFILEHNDPDKAFFFVGFFYDFNIVGRAYHERSKNPRKNRATRKRNQSKLIGKQLLR